MPENMQNQAHAAGTVPHVSGRVVLITGAGGGVGAELVERFLANGDTVLGTDVSRESLDALERRLEAGPSLTTLSADITEDSAVAGLADLARRHGSLDVLINCAGFFPFDMFDDITPQRWRQVIEVNLTGYFLVTHAMLPLLKDRGWGRIINFGSASMFPGVAGQVHYVSAKAALVGFTRSLAREVGEHGITVNTLTPGLTLTGPVVERFSPELIQSQREGRALKRDQHAADLVGPVFFLASPDAGFITGQTLNVDGGMFMH